MLCLSLVRYNRGAKNHRMKSEVRYSVLVCDIIAIFGWMLQILLLIVISETWVCYIVGHLDCFFEFNPIRHGGGAHFAHGRFFCLLWEHQESWESEIFREFLKFIKVFGLQFKKKKNLYLRGIGLFARTFSDIWNMVLTWSMSKFSQQKFNFLVIYYFLFQV